MLIYSCFSCSCLFLFELLNLCGVIERVSVPPFHPHTALLRRLCGVIERVSLRDNRGKIIVKSFP